MSEAAAGAPSEHTYDVVVLGGGPVGVALAGRARSAALSVVVVEKELVGGECQYRACVPSKALLRPVIAVADARRVEGARAAVNAPLDAAAAFARRDGFVFHWTDDPPVGLLKGWGAELVRGHGRLDGSRRVAVETLNDGRVVLSARHAVAVCTGSRAALPDLPGITEARPWISRDATSASTVPERLAIVGGGGVGVEMSSAYRGLGASVTLLVRDARLLPEMEPFVGEVVVRGLVEAGVDVRTGVTVTGLSRPGGTGPVTMLLDDGGELEADEVLFAIGRVPLTDDIGLETVGLTPGSWLEVDCTCRVRAINDGWLYALGDVNHHAILTHQGKYQARIVGDAIAARAAGRPLDTAPWGAHATTADFHAVPRVFFCDPEATAVGLSAEQAERAGYRVRAVDVEIGQVDGANLYADGYRGRARMVVDLDHGCLFGVTFVGPGVAELLHSATVAVAGQVPIDRLWHVVPCYPSISEVWLHLLEAYRS